MTISAIIVMTLLVLGLCLMCAVISMALRRHTALLWMGTALGIGVIESLALKDGTITQLDLVLTCVTIPLSYMCVGESVRSAFGVARSSGRYFALIGGLTGLSVVLLQLPFAPVLQLIPCQVAGVLAIFRTIACVSQNRRRGDKLDAALLLVFVCVALVFLIRIPFMPILVSLDTPFTIMSRQALQDALILVFSILVPAVVILTVAKVVGNAVDFHRMRAEFDLVSALPNRRAFEGEMSRAARGPGQLIVCDIDKFKLVNDRFGHAAGDAVIRAVAGLLEGRGMAARIGGEEFAVWLPACERSDAVRHAEELRREIASLRLVEIVGDHAITASFGVAQAEAHSPLEEIFAAADTALYRAKHAGRNRVTVFEEMALSPRDRRQRDRRREAA